MDQLVPFHVKTIKSVSISSSGEWTHLRINFLSPVVAVSRNTRQPDAAIAHNTLMFVKELTYRAQGGETLQYVHNKIKQMQKTQKQKEKQNEEAPIVKQGKLKLKTKTQNFFFFFLFFLFLKKVWGGMVSNFIFVFLFCFLGMKTHVRRLPANQQPLVLRDLTCKPTLGGRKKATGRLETHMNGFRYVDHKKQEISLEKSKI